MKNELKLSKETLLQIMSLEEELFDLVNNANDNSIGLGEIREAWTGLYRLLVSDNLNSLVKESEVK